MLCDPDVGTARSYTVLIFCFFVLQRQSSFSQQARTQRLTDKRLL